MSDEQADVFPDQTQEQENYPEESEAPNNDWRYTKVKAVPVHYLFEEIEKCYEHAERRNQCAGYCR